MRKNLSAHVLSLFLMAALLTVATALPARAKDAQDAGRISALSGEVKVLREGGEPRAARAFDVVRIKDTIMVGPNSMVKIIFYADYHEEMIKGKSMVEIARKSAVIREGSKECISVTRKPPASALPDNPSHNGRSVAAGVIKGETLLPRGAFGSGSETPAFTWEKAGDASYYKVAIKILKDEKPSEYITAVITSNSYTVPAQKKLTFGTRYVFMVSACEHDPDDPAYKDMTDNIVASNDEAPYCFVLPSKENLAFIDEESRKLQSLKKESPEWSSSASLLLIACMELGLVDKAGALAREMLNNGIANDDLSRIAFRYGPRPQNK